MLIVLSRDADATWPAIPTSRASQLLAVQFQLEQSQWLPPDKLYSLQWQQLQRVVQHAYQHVPFYRDRLEASGVVCSPPTLTSAEKLGWEDWQKIPLLTRDDIQAAGTQLHSVPLRTNHGTISQTSTSGSTGTPVVTLGTTVTRMMWSACMLRQHLWARRDFSGKLCSIRACEKTAEFTNHNWGLGTLDIVHTGPAATLDIHTNVEEQARWLIEQDPDYLLTYPSVLTALIDHFQRTGQRLQRLREVRTFGEVVEPQCRRLCRQCWNVPLSDVYSTQEIGYVAIQCPEVEDHYHIQSENVLLEVLADDGRPCRPCEVGRVVITTLQNFAMPLIRYEIGDYAEVGSQCSCGRGLPVLRRILGRKRNMFILPTGGRRWPCMDTTVEGLHELTCVRQFQVIQRTLTELDVNLRVVRPLTEEEKAIIRRTLVSGLGYPFEIQILYVDSIARSPSGKFEDYRCDIVADRSADPMEPNLNLYHQYHTLTTTNTTH